MRKFGSQSGQTLLIVILIMVVALTVGLSLASRSVVNLKLTTEEENSQKALSAAEAGIEQALIGKNASNQPLGGAVINNVTILPSAGNSFLVNNGNTINKDDGVDIWLTNYNSDPTKLYQNPWTGTLTIYWGNQTDKCDPDPLKNTMAALEIIVITGTPPNAQNNPVLTKYAYDSSQCNLRLTSNNFTAGNPNSVTTFNGVTPANSTNLISVTNGLIIRVIPFYANTIIGVQASSNLPTQGQVITSTGVAGATQREISYYQANDSLPSEFFYSIFSAK